MGAFPFHFGTGRTWGVNLLTARAAQHEAQGRVLYAKSQSSAIDPRETVPDILVTNEHTLCPPCAPASRAVPRGLTPLSSAVLAFGCRAVRSAPGPSAVPGCRTSPLSSASPAAAGCRSRNSDSVVTPFGNRPLVTADRGLVAPSAPTGPVNDGSEFFRQIPRGPPRHRDTNRERNRRRAPAVAVAVPPVIPQERGRREALSTHGAATAAAWARSDPAGKDASECRG